MYAASGSRGKLYQQDLWQALIHSLGSASMFFLRGKARVLAILITLIHLRQSSQWDHKTRALSGANTSVETVVK